MVAMDFPKRSFMIKFVKVFSVQIHIFFSYFQLNFLAKLNGFLMRYKLKRRYSTAFIIWARCTWNLANNKTFIFFFLFFISSVSLYAHLTLSNAVQIVKNTLYRFIHNIEMPSQHLLSGKNIYDFSWKVINSRKSTMKHGENFKPRLLT